MPVEGKDLSSRQTQYVVKNLEIGNLSTPQVFRNCMGRGQNRKGFGWKRWSRRWLYEPWGCSTATGFGNRCRKPHQQGKS
jgi:hypothetical protein